MKKTGVFLVVLFILSCTVLSAQKSKSPGSSRSSEYDVIKDNPHNFQIDIGMEILMMADLEFDNLIMEMPIDVFAFFQAADFFSLELDTRISMIIMNDYIDTDEYFTPFARTSFIPFVTLHISDTTELVNTDVELGRTYLYSDYNSDYYKSYPGKNDCTNHTKN